MENKLYKHAFWRLIGEHSKEFMENNPPTDEFLKRWKDGKKGTDKFEDLKGHEQYLKLVYHCLQNITETIEDIEHIKVYLRQYPYRKSLEKSGISRSKYMQYHLENYYLRIVSLIDKFCLLINEVYEIGLPGKFCKFHILRDIRKLQNTKIIKYLNSLNSGLASARSQRNYIAHERKIELEDVVKMSFLEMMNELTEENDEFFSAKYLFVHRKFRDSSIQEINKSLNSVYDFFIASFDNLLPEYTKRYESKNASSF